MPIRSAVTGPALHPRRNSIHMTGQTNKDTWFEIFINHVVFKTRGFINPVVSEHVVFFMN